MPALHERFLYTLSSLAAFSQIERGKKPSNVLNFENKTISLAILKRIQEKDKIRPMHYLSDLLPDNKQGQSH